MTRRAVSLDPAASGEENMSRDRTLLERADSAPDSMTVVRLYRWSAPTVSVGRHQDLERAVDLAYCTRNGIQWVRRPTGGRAVLHDRELTYAVVSNDAELFPVGDISGTYRLISQLVGAAMRSLDLEVTLQRRRRSTQESPGRLSPCFVAAARHELLLEGKKLMGSAQRHLRRSFLQHGSIPIGLDYEMQGKVLRFDPDRMRATVVSLEEVLTSAAAGQEFGRALLRTFRRYLGLSGAGPYSPG